MKKVLLIVLIALISVSTTTSQVSVSEENDIKNFRFGLMGGLSFDWLRVDNDKKFEAGGVGVGYHWGLQLEFKLNNNISLVTGLSLTTNNFKLNYTGASSADTVMYILDKDEEFVEFGNNEETNSAFLTPTNDVYWLKERNARANFVNIPIGLKMKTNEIGYLTYFGSFGANLGIKTGAKSNDLVQQINIDTTGGTTTLVYDEELTKEKLDISESIQPVRLGLRIGGGAEYNFSGSTSAFFEVNYNHYFTNAFRGEKNENFLNNYDFVDMEYENVGAKVFPGSVSITVGILF